MYVEDGVDLFERHVGEATVTEDAGVADHDVELSEGVQGRVDDRPPAFRGRHRVVVRHGYSPGPDDLIDHSIGGRFTASRAIDRAAEVVDDHRGASARELHRIGPSQPATGTRHDRYPSIECDGIGHLFLLLIQRPSERPTISFMISVVPP